MSWKKTKIGEFLKQYKDPIEIKESNNYNLVTVSNTGNIYLRKSEIGLAIKSSKLYKIKEQSFIYSRLSIHNGAFGLVPKNLDGAVVSDEMPVFKFDEKKINKDFFLFSVKSNDFIFQLSLLTKGVGRVRVKESNFLNLEIFLPSLDQQKQIAEKLKLNEVKQKLLQQEIDTQKTNLKNLRKQILQDAIEGKLTKEWREKNPDVESASELLKKIKREKEKLIAEKKIKREKSLPEINKNEIPFDLPKNWVWVRLGDVTNFISGNNFDSYDFKKGLGIKCIKITNAGVGELIETDDTLPEEFLDKYNSFLIYEGDLVLALTRPYIIDGLKISLCNKTYDKSLLNQRVASIKNIYKKYLETKYIYSFLRTDFVLNTYKSMFENKGQQPNLKKSDVTNLLFPLPPLAEQLAIVSKLQTLMQKLDEAEKQIEKSLENSKLLTKAILAEAFSFS